MIQITDNRGKAQFDDLNFLDCFSYNNNFYIKLIDEYYLNSDYNICRGEFPQDSIYLDKNVEVKLIVDFPLITEKIKNFRDIKDLEIYIIKDTLYLCIEDGDDKVFINLITLEQTPFWDDFIEDKNIKDILFVKSCIRIKFN